jgi:hypothetical protein
MRDENDEEGEGEPKGKLRQSASEILVQPPATRDPIRNPNRVLAAPYCKVPP